MTETSQFSALGLPDDLVKSIVAMGFSEPTQVQREAVPLIDSGRDVIIQSRTGTGKTLAFGLPMLAKLNSEDLSPQMLVICPTRELAMQVAAQLHTAGGHRHIAATAVYGGTKIDPQIQALLYGSHVVVGTPGRLNDLIEGKHLKLNKCRYVVLDEADEMLDMGFRLAIEYILGWVPNERQTVLCSATMPAEVRAIAETYMTNPATLAVNMTAATPLKISHQMIEVRPERKSATLTDLLRKDQPPLAIVFCRTKAETRELFNRLQRAGFRVGMLQGDMEQDKRTEALARFKSGEINLMVATDVAARGIDVDSVSLVINYSVPQDPETYVHRSGRTGRAGKEGVSLIFVTPEDRYYFAQIEKKVSFMTYGSPAPAPTPEIAASKPAIDTESAAEPAARPARGIRSRRPAETAPAIEAEFVESTPAPLPTLAIPTPLRRDPAEMTDVDPAEWEHLPSLIGQWAEAPLGIRFQRLAESLLAGATAEELVKGLLVSVMPRLANGSIANGSGGDNDGQRRRRGRRRRRGGGGGRQGEFNGGGGDFGDS
ncbi:MAG: DEAD/DEAH box helicase [Candidatus Sericytochromatia bacterium]|nr:DEAD/DEAH box helicase [Candidatus Sericytochromatia bacterium]